jgi:hypothetical protein
MATFRKDDRVKTKVALDAPEGSIPKGSLGTVTADAHPDVATVRVKFDQDPNQNTNFRVVPKTTIQKV